MRHFAAGFSKAKAGDFGLKYEFQAFQTVFNALIKKMYKL